MKKTFNLQVPGKDARRVVELVRGDVGKYLNREKRKTLPEDHDQWEFACRVGADSATAIATDVRQVPAAIDAVAASARRKSTLKSSPRPDPE